MEILAIRGAGSAVCLSTGLENDGEHTTRSRRSNGALSTLNPELRIQRLETDICLIVRIGRLFEDAKMS